jgi:hypothetical protein
MMDLIRNNKIIVAVVGLAIAALAWYMLSGPSVPDAILTQTAVDPERQSIEAQFISSLLDLRTIRLDGQIFENPAFGALHDFSIEIVPEPVGRDNPFAPLSTQRVE